MDLLLLLHLQPFKVLFVQYRISGPFRDRTGRLDLQLPTHLFRRFQCPHGWPRDCQACGSCGSSWPAPPNRESAPTSHQDLGIRAHMAASMLCSCSDQSGIRSCTFFFFKSWPEDIFPLISRGSGREGERETERGKHGQPSRGGVGTATEVSALKQECQRAALRSPGRCCNRWPTSQG